MTSLEWKLNALNKCKSKLDPSGDKTERVRNRVSKLETAFKDYIKSDNVSSDDAVVDPLTIKIEKHPDFTTAVSHINSAISETKAAIAEEERARQAALQAKKEK